MGIMNRRVFMQTVLATGLCVSAAPVLGRARKRVIIIGGGVGGMAAARQLATGFADIDVTLIEPNPIYTACFSSGAVLAGLRGRSSLDFSYGSLQALENVSLVTERVDRIDPDKRRVHLSTGDQISFDRLIVSPGIGFVSDHIEGYDATAASVFPHAYDLGAKIDTLKNRLQELDDDELIVLSVPERPYRCTPAPYERASMMAHYLKSHKPKSKILILDSKDEFPLMDRILPAWERFYGDMIEWVPAEFGGSLQAVDPVNKTLTYDGETITPGLANIIPPQRAGDIAEQSGLADETGWCPVDAISLESSLVSNVHVIGDATDAGDMSKSAHAAASQGRVCADAVGSLLTGETPATPTYENACYFLVAPDHGLKVGGDYTAKENRITGVHGFSSAIGESDAERKATAVSGDDWFQQFTGNLFGAS